MKSDKEALETEERDIYEDRSAFVDGFCATRQWDSRNLSWPQISEIRSQPEWNDPPPVTDKPKTIVKRKGKELFVYEEGEFCCVCEATNYDSLRRFGFGDPDSPLIFMVCGACWGADGKDGAFHEWLCGEFERTMIVHDENRKLPDGRWTTKKYDPETETACPHCNSVECECSDLDVAPEIGAKG